MGAKDNQCSSSKRIASSENTRFTNISSFTCHITYSYTSCKDGSTIEICYNTFHSSTQYSSLTRNIHKIFTRSSNITSSNASYFACTAHITARIATNTFHSSTQYSSLTR